MNASMTRRAMLSKTLPAAALATAAAGSAAIGATTPPRPPAEIPIRRRQYWDQRVRGNPGGCVGVVGPKRARRRSWAGGHRPLKGLELPRIMRRARRRRAHLHVHFSPFRIAALPESPPTG